MDLEPPKAIRRPRTRRPLASHSRRTVSCPTSLDGAYVPFPADASYMPAALGALNAAASSASQSTARGFDVPPTPGQAPPPAPSAPAGSRTFQYAMQETVTTSREAATLDAQPRNSRNSSDGSLSGSNLASSFTEIRREEVEGITIPPSNRRTSSGWMRWNTPKDDKDGKDE